MGKMKARVPVFEATPVVFCIGDGFSSEKQKGRFLKSVLEWNWGIPLIKWERGDLNLRKLPPDLSKEIELKRRKLSTGPVFVVFITATGVGAFDVQLESVGKPCPVLLERMRFVCRQQNLKLQEPEITNVAHDSKSEPVSNDVVLRVAISHSLVDDPKLLEGYFETRLRFFLLHLAASITQTAEEGKS